MIREERWSDQQLLGWTDAKAAPAEYLRSSWLDGPWKTEPDKMQWRDGSTGLPCLIVRNSFGALCGYVGVYPGHPFYECNYSDCSISPRCEDKWCCEHSPEGALDVHGGITFSGICQRGGRICHVAEEGEEEPWWLGFDCAHFMDYVPGSDFNRRGSNSSDPDERYRDIAYVKAQCAKLAQQLAERGPERKRGRRIDVEA